MTGKETFQVNSWMMGLLALLVAGSLGMNIHFIQSLADRNSADIHRNQQAIEEGIKWMQSHTQEAEKRLTVLETKVDAIE
jgi:sensor domain CHASE-containing protein